jgi:hypothetical protein
VGALEEEEEGVTRRLGEEVMHDGSPLRVEGGVGLEVQEGDSGEVIMGGVIVIDLDPGVPIGGMTGGDGVRVIVVTLVVVLPLQEGGVVLGVGVHPQGEAGIGVLVVVVVLDCLRFCRFEDHAMSVSVEYEYIFINATQS